VIQVVEQRGVETRKISICPVCAAKQGISQDGNAINLNLPNLIAAMSGITAQQPPGPAPHCPACGTRLDQFQESGRLGCARCYEIFEPFIRPLVKRAQAGEAHRGLAPARLAPEAPTAEEATLRNRLKECVASERYEEAARLRDQLRALTKVEQG
jgi:protein arginine kinase activator